MEPRIECPECGYNFERRALNCPECDYIAIAKLYRYLPYNENTLSIFINNLIWAPKAKTLNDPFEFLFDLTDDAVENIPINQDSLKTAKEDLRNQGIICFSELNNNILMWAHYADGHSGICIEFDRNKDNDLGKWNICIPVIYDNCNQIPVFTSQEIVEPKSLAKIVGTKAVEWKYEKEWRLITRQGDSLLELSAEITGIIFGCKTDEVNQITIANILGRDMSYMKAKKQKNMYGLDIVPIDFDKIMNQFKTQ